MGRLRINGNVIAYEPEGHLTFEARRRDALSMGILYDFRESTEWTVHTRLRIPAPIDGEAPRSTEAQLEDHPLLDATQHVFVSVPIRTPRPGDHKVRFRTEASDASAPWGEEEPDAQLFEQAEYDLVLKVR